ncbi:hypothetical protein XENORESO_006451 [Xenotaenia resolanae]|uniref:Secreted protein n=1 Tax=Xenotaenia resolanae TaxID=208358 RepID=A0ABV0WYH1_9TELE
MRAKVRIIFVQGPIVSLGLVAPKHVVQLILLQRFFAYFLPKLSDVSAYRWHLTNQHSVPVIEQDSQICQAAVKTCAVSFPLCPRCTVRKKDSFAFSLLLLVGHGGALENRSCVVLTASLEGGVTLI